MEGIIQKMDKHGVREKSDVGIIQVSRVMVGLM